VIWDGRKYDAGEKRWWKIVRVSDGAGGRICMKWAT
jgi:hypothetical protein